MREFLPRLSAERRKSVPTVRIIVEANDRFLILQKSPDSKAAGLWEFPGGKVDGMRRIGLRRNLRNIASTGIRECLEETGIDLSETPPVHRGSFQYSFTGRGDTKESQRTVYMLHAQLATPPEVTINQTLNARGEPEDKHSAYAWVSKKQLWHLRREGLLSGNSRHFDSFLGTLY